MKVFTILMAVLSMALLVLKVIEVATISWIVVATPILVAFGVRFFFVMSLLIMLGLIEYLGGREE